MSQDPDNLYDYWRQVQRWNVGFWQTIRYWGFWPSWFWLSLSVFLIENILMALYTLLVPSLITLAIFITVSSSIAWNDPFGILVAVLLLGGFVALNALDYVITLAIAWRLRLPTMAIYGLGYFLLRYVDAIILLTSVPRAFLKASNGKWSPPKRWVNGHKKIPLAQTT